MSLPTEDPGKVANIVGNNLPNFRRLYGPLIETLPNIGFNDPACKKLDWMDDSSTNLRLEQDMDPVKRGNIVRRLPKAFREKLYLQYQKKFQIPQLEFSKMLEQSADEDATSIKRRQGGPFDQRIVSEPAEDLRREVRGVIKKTISWPSTSQSLKGPVTSGFRKTWRYMGDKMAKHREGKKRAQEAAAAPEGEVKIEKPKA
jgi:translocator assembly and maintenance protein 41